MNPETSPEKFPGEYFRGGLLQQDLHRLTEELREKLNDREVGAGFVQQRLHTPPNATVILQVLEGRICLQAGEAHQHPEEGDHLVIEPGATHAIQGQTESTVPLTITRD